MTDRSQTTPEAVAIKAAYQAGLDAAYQEALRASDERRSIVGALYWLAKKGGAL